MIENQQGSYPVALEISHGGLHLLVHLIDQIRQFIRTAATRAAPMNLPSGSDHFQRVAALRADEGAQIPLYVKHEDGIPFCIMYVLCTII